MLEWQRCGLFVRISCCLVGRDVVMANCLCSSNFCRIKDSLHVPFNQEVVEPCLVPVANRCMHIGNKTTYCLGSKEI